MPTSTVEPEQALLLTPVQLARLLGISLRHVWRMRDAGRLPKPIRLGKLIRWQKTTIERWLAENEEPRA